MFVSFSSFKVVATFHIYVFINVNKIWHDRMKPEWPIFLFPASAIFGVLLLAFFEKQLQKFEEKKAIYINTSEKRKDMSAFWSFLS